MPGLSYRYGFSDWTRYAPHRFQGADPIQGWLIEKGNPFLTTYKDAFVYWNLHRKCYSIQQKGIVVAHADRIVVSNPSFRVNEKDRLKVVATGHKTVHAGVQGDVHVLHYLSSGPVCHAGTSTYISSILGSLPVRYNPLTCRNFQVSALGSTFALNYTKEKPLQGSILMGCQARRIKDTEVPPYIPYMWLDLNTSGDYIDLAKKDTVKAEAYYASLPTTSTLE